MCLRRARACVHGLYPQKRGHVLVGEELEGAQFPRTSSRTVAPLWSACTVESPRRKAEARWVTVVSQRRARRTNIFTSLPLIPRYQAKLAVPATLISRHRELPKIAGRSRGA